MTSRNVSGGTGKSGARSPSPETARAPLEPTVETQASAERDTQTLSHGWTALEMTGHIVEYSLAEAEIPTTRLTSEPEPELNADVLRTLPQIAHPAPGPSRGVEKVGGRGTAVEARGARGADAGDAAAAGRSRNVRVPAELPTPAPYSSDAASLTGAAGQGGEAGVEDTTSPTSASRSQRGATGRGKGGARATVHGAVDERSLAGEPATLNTVPVVRSLWADAPSAAASATGGASSAPETASPSAKAAPTPAPMAPTDPSVPPPLSPYEIPTRILSPAVAPPAPARAESQPPVAAPVSPVVSPEPRSLPEQRPAVEARAPAASVRTTGPGGVGADMDLAVPHAEGAAATPPLPENEVRLEPGGQIGEYALIEQIGEGGMAVIFRARHKKRGDIVAIKALHSNQQSALASQRFDREYRAMRSIQHPNVVRIHEYGIVDHQAYIAMELVEGHDLKAHLKILRALPAEDRWKQTEAILIQLCNALQVIHKHGFIHRDLKPSNILLTRDNHVKLTDFGVAKQMLGENNQLTAPGMLVGTLAYLAPEVFEQGEQNHRLDLYALGVMLYVMLTDKLPFSGKNIVQIMQKHLKHIPEVPRVVNPDVPQYLSDITMKLLEKRPDDRYQDAREVVRALELGRRGSMPVEQEITEARPLDDVWIPKLVGREAALHAINLALQKLSQQNIGSVIMLEGVEGSGRSRVIASGLELAQQYGIPVYSGRCFTGAQAWAEGFRGVFRDVVAEASRTGEPSIPKKKLQKVVDALDLSERPLPAQTPTEAPDPELDGDIMSLFRAMAIKSPRVLWIDDIDAADIGTLRALGEVIKQVTLIGGPLMVVVSTQPLRPDTNPTLHAMFHSGRLAINTQRITLPSLTPAEIKTLVGSLLTGHPKAGLVADRVLQESQGHVMAAVEVMRLLMDRRYIGRLEGQTRWAMPANIQDLLAQLVVPRLLPELIEERLKGIHAGSKTVVSILALWGRDMQLTTLCQIMNAPEDNMLEHLRWMKRSGWVVESWVGGIEAYRLAHPLYRSIILKGLDPTSIQRMRSAIFRRVPGLATVRS